MHVVSKITKHISRLDIAYRSLCSKIFKAATNIAMYVVDVVRREFYFKNFIAILKLSLHNYYKYCYNYHAYTKS